MAVIGGLLVAGIGCQTEAGHTPAHMPPTGAPTAPPEWVDAGAHPDFSATDFITGFGASDVSAAEADARANAEITASVAAKIGDGVEKILADESAEVRAGVAAVLRRHMLGPPAMPDEKPLAEPPGADLLPRARVKYFTDGYTYYALWAVDRAALGRALPSPAPIGEIRAPADAQDLADQAAAVVLEKLAAMGAAKGRDEAVVKQLAAVWNRAAKQAAAVRASAEPSGKLRIRRRRSLTISLTLTLPEPATDNDGQPAADYAEPSAAPDPLLADAVMIFADDLTGATRIEWLRDSGDESGEESGDESGEEDGAGFAVPAVVLPPPAVNSQRELTRALGTATVPISPGDASVKLSLRITPRGAVGDDGRFELRVARVPVALLGWWPTLPIPAMAFEYVLPTMANVWWRSEVDLRVDHLPQPPGVFSSLLVAVMLQARLAEFADLQLLPADAEPPADSFGIVFRGTVNIVTNPERRRPEVRAAVEIAVTDGGPSLGALTIIGEGPGGSGSPLAALKEAFSRPSITTDLRGALARLLYD